MLRRAGPITSLLLAVLGPPCVWPATDPPSDRVIVGVSVAWKAEGALSRSEQGAQKNAIAAAQQALLDELRDTDARLVHRFATIPFLTLEATPAARDRLAASKGVTSVEPDRLWAPLLAQSAPLVQANQAWAAGLTGLGATIAVLDAGVQASHPFFGGRVVAEACFSSNGPGIVSLCPNGQTTQSGPGSAAPPSCAELDYCNHGTQVVGIAAGSGASFSGVARGATVVAVQVFSAATQPSACAGIAPCPRAFTSDVIRGLEYVLSLQGSLRLAAVNLSLGVAEGPLYTSEAACDAGNPAVKAAIDNLRSLRVASVAATGNDGAINALLAPACISSAVAVGSTTKLDAMSTFSNSSSMVELLAPGTSINSSITGGGFAMISGTSMATAHVSGAWAIVKQRKPSATVTEVLGLLASTGLAITDPRNGVVRPRIRIKTALDAVVDDLPPEPQPGDLYTLPCRIIDTREPTGPLGGPALQPGALRLFPLVGPRCGVPQLATTVAINVTVVNPTALGDVRLFPGDVRVPMVSTVNFGAGQTRANHAVIRLSGDGLGSLSVLNDALGTVHLVVDVAGYFQ